MDQSMNSRSSQPACKEPSSNAENREALHIPRSKGPILPKAIVQNASTYSPEGTNREIADNNMKAATSSQLNTSGNSKKESVSPRDVIALLRGDREHQKKFGIPSSSLNQTRNDPAPALQPMRHSSNPHPSQKKSFPGSTFRRFGTFAAAFATLFAGLKIMNSTSNKKSSPQPVSLTDKPPVASTQPTDENLSFMSSSTDPLLDMSQLKFPDLFSTEMSTPYAQLESDSTAKKVETKNAPAENNNPSTSSKIAAQSSLPHEPAATRPSEIVASLPPSKDVSAKIAPTPSKPVVTVSSNTRYSPVFSNIPPPVYKPNNQNPQTQSTSNSPTKENRFDMKNILVKVPIENTNSASSNSTTVKEASGLWTITPYGQPIFHPQGSSIDIPPNTYIHQSTGTLYRAQNGTLIYMPPGAKVVVSSISAGQQQTSGNIFRTPDGQLVAPPRGFYSPYWTYRK